MKFASGSLFGTALFTLASFQTPSSVTVDNSGNVYTGTSNGVFRYVPSSSAISLVTTQNYWYTSRLRFDTYGNMYMSGYMVVGVYRYNITTNNC